MKRELEKQNFKLLEKKEFHKVMKFLPDLADNYFFSQPTVEAILFYDIYDLLEENNDDI